MVFFSSPFGSLSSLFRYINGVFRKKSDSFSISFKRLMETKTARRLRFGSSFSLSLSLSLSLFRDKSSSSFRGDASQKSLLPLVSSEDGGPLCRRLLCLLARVKMMMMMMMMMMTL